MWPHKTMMYFGLFWAACLLALINPIWGVVNYLMAYQTNPTDTWWGIPLVTLGMRFSMLAALFTLAGFLTGRKNVPKFRPNVSYWELGVLLLVAIAALNLLIGYGYTSSAKYAFEKLWKMLLFVLILGRLASTRRNFQLVIWAFVAGSLYIGHDAYTASPSAFRHGRLNQIGGPDFSTTSGTAAHLAAMLPLIGMAFLTARRLSGRALAAIAGAFTVNAIILCRTRSAFLGLLCGALAAVLFAPRARRFRIHLLLGTGMLLAYSLTDGHFWTRMDTLRHSEVLATDAATVSRTDIWKASRRILRDKPLGIGPGNFPAVIGTYNPRYKRRSTHNTLVVCFVELGVQGGMLFLCMVGGSFWFLWRVAALADRTKAPLETRIMAYGTLVALVTYLVSGLGTERFYCESFWWILTLPLCLHRVVVQEVAAYAPGWELEGAANNNEPHPALGGPCYDI